MIAFDGYRPGSLAGVVALHMDYYGPQWGFGLAFEAKVARELADFLSGRDSGRDLFLTAWRDDDLVGSVTVDVAGGGAHGAHLRWFVVSDAVRGSGFGGELMRRAMEHVDAHAGGAAWLTTFAGLEPARALYLRHGFTLVQEAETDQWRGGVREQLYLRSAANRLAPTRETA